MKPKIVFDIEYYKNGKIAVAGAGGWGTALAMVLAQNGIKIKIWTYEKSTADEINNNHTNETYLPGIKLHKNIKAVSDFSLLKDCELIISTIPTQFIRNAIVNLHFPIDNKYIINGSKGLEVKTDCRISQIFEEAGGVTNDRYCVLSGPSHAEETARNLPTAVVVASVNKKLAKLVQLLFNNEYFRVYTSKDVIGSELGAALKNVIALAAGIADGLGMGDNTKAALLTRGLAEMSRLGDYLGTKKITFSGLSGVGDLIVTCNSVHSRNRRAGIEISKGKSVKQIISESKTVAEGITTTKAAYELSKKIEIELPIIEQVYNIVYLNKDPKTALYDLMTREIKKEWWWEKLKKKMNNNNGKNEI